MRTMKLFFMLCSITLPRAQHACQQTVRMKEKTTARSVRSIGLRSIGKLSLASLTALAILPHIRAENTTSTLHEAVINDGLLPLIGQALVFSTLAANVARTWMGIKIESEFCANFNDSSYSTRYHAKTIDAPEVQAEDDEQLIPYIRAYAPILYFHQQEAYFPLRAEEWCTGPETKIRSQIDATIIDHVSMQKLQKIFHEQELQANHTDLYFENPACALYGADPAINSDAQGNLRTPSYVITSQEGEAWYLQFMFLYGFNQPYDLGPFTGDIIAKQNAHEADLEHITIELDRATKKMRRIFYAAHGSHEGVWLPANHTDITYEGTHPVAFVARGAHGTYPKEGTYVRIYGVGNDITQKGLRWTPQLIRIYQAYDRRFDPETMSWSIFPGDLGKRGVSPPSGQSWYTTSLQGDLGKNYDELLFCENPTWPEDTFFKQIMSPAFSIARYLVCIASKARDAAPPTAKPNS